MEQISELVKFIGFSGFVAIICFVVWLANIGFHIKKLNKDVDAAHVSLRKIDKNVTRLLTQLGLEEK